MRKIELLREIHGILISEDYHDSALDILSAIDYEKSLLQEAYCITTRSEGNIVAAYECIKGGK